MEKAAWLAMTAFCISKARHDGYGTRRSCSAVWCHNYFRTRVEGFKSEMSNAALETTTFLNAHPEWRSRSGQPIPKVSDLFLDTRMLLAHTLGRFRTIISVLCCQRCGVARSIWHFSSRAGCTGRMYGSIPMSKILLPLSLLTDKS